MIEFENMTVRCRMAPSPTGKLHIGTAHTALFNFLYAKHFDGTFILRIDDSDPVRSKREFETDIMDSLKWLGVHWDEGPDVGGPYAPYRQSERLRTYKKYSDKLLEENKAYRCFCSKEELTTKREALEKAGKKYIYDQKCRYLTKDQVEKAISEGKSSVIRFVNQNKVVTFDDMVRGEISVDTTDYGDFIITRPDESPLLNFAVVVDDIEFEITHAIRGEDFLNATPNQILLFEALGVTPPKIANLSFIYAPDHTKLSKRHGATGLSEYEELGYLPEAVVNFLALLGWNPGDERELFTMDDLIKEFTIEKVQKNAPTFNIIKLNWFNQQYIKKLSDDELVDKLSKFSVHSPKEIKKIVHLVRDRLVTLKDFDELTSYFFERPEITQQLDKKILDVARMTLEENFDGKILETEARKYCLENNIKVGDFFMALRLAITGKTATPPLWDVMQIFGKEETLTRLNSI